MPVDIDRLELTEEERKANIFRFLMLGYADWQGEGLEVEAAHEVTPPSTAPPSISGR